MTYADQILRILRLEKLSASERFRTHASITARLFFEKRGFQVVKEQTVKRNGVEMMNYVMVK